MGYIGNRIIEAYLGEYASGKSENAVNRALELVKKGRKVTLVDLDLVEPFYTLRPIKNELTAKGIEVLAWETKQTMGLGEAGSIIRPDMRWAFRREGDIIFDIGYGVHGAKTLNLVEGAWENEDLQVIAVINISRPITSTVEDIVDYVRSLGRVDALINNSHLGEETDTEIIQEGARIVTEAAEILGLPVIATAAEARFGPLLGDKDCMGNPIRFLERYMNRTFW